MNLNKTNLDDAFNFDSPIKYSAPKYSTQCIWCNHEETIALLKDGSYRQCVKCRKQFSAKPLQTIQQVGNTFFKQPPIFHTLSRPLFMEPNPNPYQNANPNPNPYQNKIR
jgi:hypothetical protein